MVEIGLDKVASVSPGGGGMFIEIGLRGFLGGGQFQAEGITSAEVVRWE